MLEALGVESLDLLSNNPDKVAQLEAYGIRVRRRVRTGLHLGPENRDYLATKAAGGHLLRGAFGFPP
jgi:GTP cyclohydrolase II